MKKLSILLVLCMASSVISGCTLDIPTLSEARNIVDAYGYYNQTGELPENIKEILENNDEDDGESANFEELIKNTPEETLKSTLEATTKSDILRLAKQYYEMAYPKIEGDTKSEYNRLITWDPDFSGNKASDEEIKRQKFSSVNVTLALSYTNAKNFYLAMATSVFSINAEDHNAAGNFAAATAAYADDLILEGAASSSVTKYYKDAEKIYHYSLLKAGKDGKYARDALPLLVSLGNLYLDDKGFEEAYACFQSALKIDEEYSPAVEGLYNTYMALHQYQKALDLIADSQKLPAFVGGSVKTAKKSEEDAKKTLANPQSIEEQVLQNKLEAFDEIESISTAEFLDIIDAEAKDKLNGLIRQVQDKMKYKSPEITLISQYASLKAISEPMGVSALEAFGEAADQYMTEASDRMEKIYTDVDEESYERLASSTKKYMQKKDHESLKEFFGALSEVSPEYSIYTLNPYEYSNPVDFIVQRRNIENFNNKFITYHNYMGIVNMKVEKQVREIIDNCNKRVDAMWDEMDKALGDLPEDASEEDVHKVHTSYYPKINNLRSVSWNQATQVTVTAYEQKIKKYAEQMYNDCMKYVILVSDDAIQQRLEEKVKADVLHGLALIYEQLYTSFSFVYYDNDCGCDIAGIKAKRDAEERERKVLEKEQAKKNMEAKKRFESGELDENSEYYKKIIKPYEVRINTPFVQGVVGPYKSSFKIKLELPGTPLPTLEFEQVENHIRNTTTYSGGMEIGASAEIGSAEAGAKAYLKATATQGSDGNFAMDDVDVIGGGKATLGNDFASGEVGMEASAIRGTKSYTNFSVTGDSILNDELKEAMGDWTPNLTKELWSGEYPLH